MNEGFPVTHIVSPFLYAVRTLVPTPALVDNVRDAEKRRNDGDSDAHDESDTHAKGLNGISNLGGRPGIRRAVRASTGPGR